MTRSLLRTPPPMPPIGYRRPPKPSSWRMVLAVSLVGTAVVVGALVAIRGLDALLISGLQRGAAGEGGGRS